MLSADRHGKKISSARFARSPPKLRTTSWRYAKLNGLFEAFETASREPPGREIGSPRDPDITRERVAWAKELSEAEEEVRNLREGLAMMREGKNQLLDELEEFEEEEMQ